MGLFNKKKDTASTIAPSVKSSDASISDQTTLASLDLKPENGATGADGKPKTFTEDPAFWEQVNKYKKCEHYAGGWTGMAGEPGSTPQTDALDSQASTARVQKERANRKWWEF